MPSNERQKSEAATAVLEELFSFHRDLSAALSTENDAGALWELVLDAVVQIESIDCGWVQAVDGQQQTAALVGARNLSPELTAHVDSHDIHTQLADVISTREILYQPRSRFPASAQEELRAAGLQWVLVLPIVHRDEVAAIVNVASCSEEGAPRWVRFLLAGISAQVSGALTRIRALTQLADRNVWLNSKADEDGPAEDKFRKIFQLSPVIMALSDPNAGAYVDVNDAFLRQFGFAREEVVGRSASELGILDSATRDELYRIMREEGCVLDRELSLRGKDGRLSPLIFSTHWMELQDRPMMLSTAVDISDRKQAEEERHRLAAQLAQAQKMESVGRLAGGVAHDFNNMLTVIQANAELALAEAATEQARRDNLAEILETCERSAELTYQLLAFSRQQTVSPKILDLNEIVGTALKMLNRLIGERIELSWRPAKELGRIRMDAAQIDQVLTNLCINARDAIADAGTITVETANATFDEESRAHDRGLIPGDYVLLAVSDDGRGMDTETQARLFEPFFTTKPLGEGTGLGLATVYGIVEQNRGFTRVHSALGKGTRFEIYFPRYVGSAEQPVAAVKSAKSYAGGGETILLVEDEAAILSLATAMLTQHGYVVLAANSPNEAIRLAGEQSGRIDLLMTDVVMPRMNGRDLAEKLRTLYPGIKCLFMSAYTANVIAQHGILDEGVHFIAKPFKENDLLASVREALDQE